MDTRGPGPGLRRAGRQTDRAGAKERYAPAQLLRSSRARQTGHSNGEARQGRDDSSAGNRPPFHAACRSSSSSCAKQAKNDGYSPATAPRCRLRQKKAWTPRQTPRPLALGNCYGSGCVIRVALITCGIVPCAHRSCPYAYDDTRTQVANGQC